MNRGRLTATERAALRERLGLTVIQGSGPERAAARLEAELDAVSRVLEAAHRRMNERGIPPAPPPPPPDPVLCLELGDPWQVLDQ